MSAAGAFAAALRLETFARQGDLAQSRDAYIDLIREIEDIKPKLLQVGKDKVF